jgi:hypothetical protein
VLASYAAALVFGALGIVIMFLDPRSTVILTGVVGVLVLAVLVWLGRVPMES